jgi:hypothetical protein
LNQESSPDRLAFQVSHTIISPNYPGEELETLDRQIVDVSADVPPQDGETYGGKNKSERRPRKSGGHKKKEQVMVAGASDIDSSSCYSSSSSSDEDENRRKGKWSSKNINGQCFAAQGFCGMAHCSASKKNNKDDSGSDSKEEVGGMEGFWLIDFDCSQHMTIDRRWFSSLTPVMTKEYITFGDNKKGRVLSVGRVKVCESVTLRRVYLAKSLGYNLLSLS